MRGQRARLFDAVLAGHAERDRRARDDAAAGDVRRDGARVLVRQCHHARVDDALAFRLGRRPHGAHSLARAAAAPAAGQ